MEKTLIHLSLIVPEREDSRCVVDVEDLDIPNQPKIEKKKLFEKAMSEWSKM